MSDDELAAADPYLVLTEREAREYADDEVNIPKPFDVRRLLFEYDRRGECLEDALSPVALVRERRLAVTRHERDVAERDLARALPVVEAARELVDHHESLGWTVGQEVALLDALVREVRR